MLDRDPGRGGVPERSEGGVGQVAYHPRFTQEYFFAGTPAQGALRPPLYAGDGLRIVICFGVVMTLLCGLDCTGYCRGVNEILQTAKRVLDFLERRGVNAALVGGIAVSARAEPRFTRDVDVAVAVANDAEAEALLHAIRSIGYVATDLVEQESVGRLATARCVKAADPHGIVVDLLFASSGLESEIAQEAEELEISEGVRVRVALPVHLLATKVLSRSSDRPQDDLDARALLQLIDSEGLGKVAQLLALVESRGYSRGKALQSELESLIGASSG